MARNKAVTASTTDKKATTAAKPASAKGKRKSIPSAKLASKPGRKKATAAAKPSSATMRKRKPSTAKPTSADVKPDDRVSPLRLTKEQQEIMDSRLVAAKFGNMITVLMQSKFYENLRLKDLRNYVVPPLINSQCRIAEGKRKGSGNTVPAGLIFWARVSDEIQEKLIGSLDAPFVLSADEWTSGDNYWIIDAIGPQRFLVPLLTDLRKTDFKGKDVKYRVQTPNGREIRTLQDEAA